MGKDKLTILLLALSISMVSCGDKTLIDNADLDNGEKTQLGTVIFDFPIPERRVPIENIHRIDLSIAVDAEHLYKGYFIFCANVSDIIRSYSISLEEGTYYYQAGITCSSLGDTCLWDGYPGGQYGTKWTAGTIDIVVNEHLLKNLVFLE